MTATIIPFAVLKARIDERKARIDERVREDTWDAFVTEAREAKLTAKDYFLLGMQQLMQSNAERKPSPNYALLESIYRTDCGEWPKWEDYT